MCVCAYACACARVDAYIYSQSHIHPSIPTYLHHNPTNKHSPLLERKAKPVEKEEFERVQRALRQDRYAKAS